MRHRITKRNPIPRIIYCGEEDEDFLSLPRGCEDDLIALLEDAGVVYEMVDGGATFDPVSVTFKGTLRSSQPQAVEAMLAHDCGVLKANTSYGKTVVGSYLIASLKLPTLIIVDKTNLVDQWIEKLGEFLEIRDTREPPLTKSGRPSRRKRPWTSRSQGRS